MMAVKKGHESCCQHTGWKFNFLYYRCKKCKAAWYFTEDNKKEAEKEVCQNICCEGYRKELLEEITDIAEKYDFPQEKQK